MPFPSQTFSTLAQWKAWVDANIIPNGMELITGDDGNITENAAVKFIGQSPLNWDKALVVNSSGAVTATKPVVVFTGLTPASLTWGDNIYNEFWFINHTSNVIPLLGSLVYYDLTGSPVSYIPANSAVNVLKASNDLWVQGNSSGGGGGSTQKEPKSYKVSTTSGAPTAGTLTWQLTAFANSYVVLFVNGSKVNQSDMANGSPYITKTLGSDTLTISNYTGGWVAGDILEYILITP